MQWTPFAVKPHFISVTLTPLILHFVLSSSSKTWIGLSGTKTTMAWSDNTPLDYEDWQGTNPDRSDKGCVRMRVNFLFQWGDVSCTTSHQYVCRSGECLPSFMSRDKGSMPHYHSLRLPYQHCSDPSAVYSIGAELILTCYLLAPSIWHKSDVCWTIHIHYRSRSKGLI